MTGDPRDDLRTGDDNWVELSETFEKSAEVISFDPSAHYSQPLSMSLPPEEPEN